MSRLDRWKVWTQWYSDDDVKTCQVCYKNVMYRNFNTSWHIEHILSVQHGGPDVYPNVIPICPSCNLTSNRYNCTFDYMIDIGTMTPEQAYDEKQKLINNISKFMQNRYCEYITKKGPCQNGKFGKDEIFCWLHYKKECGPCPMDLRE